MIDRNVIDMLLLSFYQMGMTLSVAAATNYLVAVQLMLRVTVLATEKGLLQIVLTKAGKHEGDLKQEMPVDGASLRGELAAMRRTSDEESRGSRVELKCAEYAVSGGPSGPC
jgi:hypothetical protein